MSSRVPDKKWFDVDESAELLGVAPATVYYWIRSGYLWAKNVAAPNRRRPTYRISRETLVSAIQQQKDGLPVSV